MGHGGCDVINPLLGHVQRHVDHYGFTQFFTVCPYDPVAAYFAYERSDKIESSFLRPSDCWFSYTFNDDRVHRLSAAESTSHKRTATGELPAPQMLAVRVVTGVIDKSDWGIIFDRVVHFGETLQSEGAAPSRPPASSGVFVDVLGVDLDVESHTDLLDIPSIWCHRYLFHFARGLLARQKEDRRTFDQSSV